MPNKYHFIREGQAGNELFTFVVPARELIHFSRIERFNETKGGVERKLNYAHLLKLKRFMLQPHATIAEPILGNLEGDWNIDRHAGIITREENGFLSVDEGQHRIAALLLLPENEQEKW